MIEASSRVLPALPERFSASVQVLLEELLQHFQVTHNMRKTIKVLALQAWGYDLQGRVTDIFKTRGEKVMFVKGDNNVPFADVANVIDIAHAAGVDKVGLITAKIEAGN